ncbi:MAG: hypothetical protein ACR2Q4_07535 [Geminicoccaceae bacterium]
MGKTSRRAVAGRTRKHILASAVALSFVSTAVANAEDSFKIGVVPTQPSSQVMLLRASACPPGTVESS